MDSVSSSLLPSLQNFLPPVKAYIPWRHVADQGQDDFQSRAHLGLRLTRGVILALIIVMIVPPGPVFLLLIGVPLPQALGI